MGSLDCDYVQFINQKVLEFLPHSYVKVGDKLNMRCPLCGDSRKSVFKKRGWYYLKNASYYCFNCSTSMSGMQFLQHISGGSYQQIRKEYFKMCFKSQSGDALSSQLSAQLSSEPALFSLEPIVKPEWKNQLSSKAIEHLKSRRVLEAPFLPDDTLYSCYAKNGDEYILISWKLNGEDVYY